MKHRDAKGLGDFELVDEKSIGYAPDDVDDYFEELAADFVKLRKGSYEGIITSSMIRSHSFPQARGGYKPAEVDRALDRVEDKFSELERDARRANLGEAAWNEQVETLANTVMGRLTRPDGERFRRPSKKLVKGYYVRDVDQLCLEIKDHLQHDSVISPKVIRKARFRAATGDMSYEESQVDAFLNRCIELMLEIR